MSLRSAWGRLKLQPIIEAFKQFIFILAVTLTPIFFSVLLDSFNATEIPSLSDLLTSFSHNFRTGELFLYTVTVLAPASYVVYKYNREQRKFPAFLSWQLQLFLLIGASALIFGLQRSAAIKNEALLNLIYVVVGIWSLVIWYLSILFDELLTSAYSESLRSGEQNLVSDLKNALRRDR